MVVLLLLLGGQTWLPHIVSSLVRSVHCDLGAWQFCLILLWCLTSFLCVFKYDILGLIIMSSWSGQRTNMGSIMWLIHAADVVLVADHARILGLNIVVLGCQLDGLLGWGLLLCTLSGGVTGKAKHIGQIIAKVSKFLWQCSLATGLTNRWTSLIIWVLKSVASFHVLIHNVILSGVEAFSSASCKHGRVGRGSSRHGVLVWKSYNMASFGGVES